MKKQELFNNETEGFPYQRQPKQAGLYDAAYEHDACGVGMLVNIHGEKSHDIVESALKVLENMRHRGAEGADNKTGDGAGIMLQIPHELARFDYLWILFAFTCCFKLKNITC